MGARELRILAGDRAYGRGVDYFDQGRVIELTTRGTKTSAIVDGTESYQVSLRETPRGLEGSCTCPASDGFDFCKHCVAAALVLEARQTEFEQLAEGGSEDRIRAYLGRQPPESLVEFIIAALPDQPELRDRLSLQADLATGKIAAKDLKKRITAVTPARDVWQSRQVSRYFARLEAVLDGIAAVAEQIPADVLLATVLHGIKRLDKALERVDDSHGRRWGAGQTLRDLHTVALSRIDWGPEKKASHLLELILADPFDQFSGAVEHYGGSLGAAGLTAFYAQAQARLDALPELPFGAGYEVKAPYLRMCSLLEDKAHREGDLDGLIELAKRTCTSTLDCNRIAALYLQKGQLDDALGWLDKADRAASPRQGDLQLRAAIHRARQEWTQAIAAQQVVFERSPLQPQYHKLMELAREADQYDEVDAAARAFLLQQLDSSPWHAEVAADTLAAALMADGEDADAFALVRDHVRDPVRLLELAAIFGSNPARACELTLLAVESLIGRKNKRHYTEAVKALEAARPQFDRLAPEAFTRCLTDLRQRHKAKRSLMGLLKGL